MNTTSYKYKCEKYLRKNMMKFQGGSMGSMMIVKSLENMDFDPLSLEYL